MEGWVWRSRGGCGQPPSGLSPPWLGVGSREPRKEQETEERLGGADRAGPRPLQTPLLIRVECDALQDLGSRATPSVQGGWAETCRRGRSSVDPGGGRVAGGELRATRPTGQWRLLPCRGPWPGCTSPVCNDTRREAGQHEAWSARVTATVALPSAGPLALPPAACGLVLSGAWPLGTLCGSSSGASLPHSPPPRAAVRHLHRLQEGAQQSP